MCLSTGIVEPSDRVLKDANATHRFGIELGRCARAGQVLALTGTLGAGKTALTRGIAEGWEVAPLCEVVSPTYALMFEHESPRGRFVHVDLYRLDGIESVLGLGIEEALSDQTALAVVEWADRIPELIPDTAIWIALREHGQGRIAEIRGPAQGP